MGGPAVQRTVQARLADHLAAALRDQGDHLVVFDVGDEALQPLRLGDVVAQEEPVLLGERAVELEQRRGVLGLQGPDDDLGSVA